MLSRIIFLQFFSLTKTEYRMYRWLQKAPNATTLPLQELKIRKGTGRGRGRRSKREALAGEEEEVDYVDEGDFGFVEVWDQIVLKHEVKIF